MTKRCTKCGEVKPLTAFYTDSSRRDTYRSWCKQCLKDYRRHRREICHASKHARTGMLVNRLKRLRAAYLAEHPEEVPVR